MDKIAAGVLYLQTLLIGDALGVVQGALEWIALSGGAAAVIVAFYRRVMKPLYAVAIAAAHAAPTLEGLPEKIERMDRRHAHLEERVRNLEDS